ncbi:MAG: hypothetical protein GY701_02855 [Sulfitobacter sp.]|nr:hypothetical protein [Sulfitobacter sp.]
MSGLLIQASVGGLGGDGGLVAEPLVVGGVGGVEDGLAGGDDRRGGAGVDISGMEVAER